MDKKWYRFDDSYVAQMKENEICVIYSTFILFYFIAYKLRY